MQKILLFFIAATTFLALKGQNLSVAPPADTLFYPKDNITLFTDTSCYILPSDSVRRISDSLAKPFLYTIATYQILFEEYFAQQPKTSASKPTPNPNIQLPFLLPDSVKTATDSILPKPLWQNIKNLPPLTPDSITLAYNLQPLRPKPKDNTYLFYLFFVFAAMYAYLSFNYASYIEKLRQSVLNVYISRQFFDDFNHSNFVVNLIMFVLTTGSLGLFIFLSIRLWGKLPHLSDWLLLPTTLAGAVLIILLRRVLLLMIGKILPITSLIQFYIFNNTIISLYFSVLLLPVLLLQAFGSQAPATWAFYVSLVAWAFMILYIIYRGYTIVKDTWLHYKFHFFLYLCTLEISPLLVLYKIAITHL